MVSVGMEGRDPLLRRDKGKRERLRKCMTIFGQEKNMNQGSLKKQKQKQKQKDGITNHGAFSRLGLAALFSHLGRRGASPMLGN